MILSPVKLTVKINPHSNEHLQALTVVWPPPQWRSIIGFYWAADWNHLLFLEIVSIYPDLNQLDPEVHLRQHHLSFSPIKLCM